MLKSMFLIFILFNSAKYNNKNYSNISTCVEVLIVCFYQFQQNLVRDIFFKFFA